MYLDVVIAELQAFDLDDFFVLPLVGKIGSEMTFVTLLSRQLHVHVHAVLF
jgi:hypothetical protein